MEEAMIEGVSATLGASPEGRWQVTLHEPERPPRSLPTRVEVCDNALCHCGEVIVVGERPQGELRFRLDVFAADLVEARTELSEADQRIVAAIVDGLDEAGWARLQASFLSAKARAIERFDPSREAVPFEFDEIEEHGVLVGFDELFPHASQHGFELGDHRLIALELFCVRPSCPCGDAMVDILEVAPDGTADLALTLVIDVRGRWSAPEAASQPLGRDWGAVRRALLAKHPRFVEEVARRRELLRALYLHSVRELRPELAPAEPASSGAKVGRNAPCPCGSGLKYKRCCGG